MITKRFDVNTDGSDYIVGDIHGCYDQLIAKLDDVGFDRSVDRLFSVGDIFDRGPKPIEMIRLAQEPWFHMVQGNHEELAYNALIELIGRDSMTWVNNGGDWILPIVDRANEGDPDEYNEVIQFLSDVVSALPLAFEIPMASGKRVGVVHAEVPNSIWEPDRWERGLGRHERATFMWARDRVMHDIDTTISGVDFVVSGHSIIQEPDWYGNQLAIDCGMYLTGRVYLVRVGTDSLEIIK